MSVNFIERYLYLICFTTYLKEEAPKGKRFRVISFRMYLICGDADSLTLFELDLHW